MPKTVVMVGAGQTAAVAARTLRRLGFDGRVVLVGDEPHRPYQRPPLSKEYLAGTHDREDLFLLSEQWCTRNEVELYTGVSVSTLDSGTGAVTLSDGGSIDADSVLVATGGRPRTLGTADGDRVISLRTIDDAERLRNQLGPGRHVVIVGGGFIGLEVAATARSVGAEVTVLETAGTPLSGVLGDEIGATCAEMHRRNGVHLRTGVSVESVSESPQAGVVRAADGTVWQADLVVLGLGITPATDIAEAAGAKVDNGVVVDEYCRTSLDEVFAAGDVANHYHPLLGERIRVEHFDNANRQGAVAAKNMLGRATVYDRTHWFWSDQYEHNLQYVGLAHGCDEVIVRGDPSTFDFTAFYLNAGTVRAAFTIDRGQDIAVAGELIDTAEPVDAAVLSDEDAELADLLPGQ